MALQPVERCALLLIAVAVLTPGCGLLYRSLGGDYPAAASVEGLSSGARNLLAEALEPLADAGFVDVHVHMIGTEVDPRSESPWHPVHYGRLRVLLAAAGIDGEGDWEVDYLRRVAALDASAPVRGRRFLYALDRAYGSDGRQDAAMTPLYVANEQVLAAACAQPRHFVPVVSVHPHRQDALQRLDDYAGRGLRFVKWLPNTMGMDPADPALDAYYARLRKHDMTLLSHTGVERAIPAARQELGNPLRLRRALEAGVRVVALHAAGDGSYRDLDDPSAPAVEGWRLLLRLFDEPEFAGQLFADTSALFFHTHSPEPLQTFLADPWLQQRLVHGSDYPLSAVRAAVSLRGLVRQGFITPDQRVALAEIRDWNPLLFALVLERSLRHPEQGVGFDVQVFQRELPGMDALHCP